MLLKNVSNSACDGVRPSRHRLPTMSSTLAVRSIGMVNFSLNWPTPVFSFPPDTRHLGSSEFPARRGSSLPRLVRCVDVNGALETATRGIEPGVKATSPAGLLQTRLGGVTFTRPSGCRSKNFVDEDHRQQKWAGLRPFVWILCVNQSWVFGNSLNSSSRHRAHAASSQPVTRTNRPTVETAGRNQARSR